MGPSALTDRNESPTDAIVQSHLGKAMPLWLEVFDHIHTQHADLSAEWRYYNDGKSWLLKVSKKSKTVCWVSIADGAFRMTFYFADKAKEAISGSSIAAELKEAVQSRETTWQDSGDHNHPQEEERCRIGQGTDSAEAEREVSADRVHDGQSRPRGRLHPGDSEGYCAACGHGGSSSRAWRPCGPAEMVWGTAATTAPAPTTAPSEGSDAFFARQRPWRLDIHLTAEQWNKMQPGSRPRFLPRRENSAAATRPRHAGCHFHPARRG